MKYEIGQKVKLNGTTIAGEIINRETGKQSKLSIYLVKEKSGSWWRYEEDITILPERKYFGGTDEKD